MPASSSSSASISGSSGSRRRSVAGSAMMSSTRAWITFRRPFRTERGSRTVSSRRAGSSGSADQSKRARLRAIEAGYVIGVEDAMRTWALASSMLAGCTVQSPLELAVHEAVNEFRAREGRAPLAWHTDLALSAREHAADMAEGAVPFGHEGFEQRFRIIRAQLPDVRAAGENVARNHGADDPVQAAVLGWIDSVSHRDNLVGDWTHGGVGVAGSDTAGWYFTHLFADAG